MFRITEHILKALPSYPVNYTHAHCVWRYCLRIQWTAHTHTVYEGTAFVYSELHTSTTVRICCHNTDLAHVNGHDRIILVLFNQALYKAPWWWILCDPKHVGALSNIIYFIILIVSTSYILCISWIIKCLNTPFLLISWKPNQWRQRRHQIPYCKIWIQSTHSHYFFKIRFNIVIFYMSGNPFFRFPDQNYVRVSYLYHISTASCTSCIQTVSLTSSTNLLQEQLPYTFRIISWRCLLQPSMPWSLCP